MDPKEFAGRILRCELEKRRSLRWGTIEDAAERIFGR